MSAQGKRVGSWHAWVVFGEVCLELACLSDVQLCGVRDYKILSCCHIPGNSPDITKMLH